MVLNKGVKATTAGSSTNISIYSKPSGRPAVKVTQNDSMVNCSVVGPRSKKSFGTDAQTTTDKGTVSCQITFSEFSIQKKQPGVSVKDDDEIIKLKSFLETAVVQALNESIMLETFPKAVLEIRLIILQLGTSIIPAAINAASTAITASRIETFGMVCSNKVEGKDGSVTIALLPNFEKVTFINVDGRKSMTSLGKSLSKAFQECSKVNAEMRESLTGYFKTVKSD